MTPWVQRLLIANVAVFLAMLALPEFGNLFPYLAFQPRGAFVRPWTFITYMFLHGGFGHLLFNMIALYFFGSRLELRIGSAHFIQLYLASGITGALLSMVFSPGAAIIGASGGVFGVMYGFAHFWPRERVYIWGVLPVEARWLVIGTTALALFGGFAGTQRGTAHFAHLGGYVGAWVYLRVLTHRATASRRDWQKRVNAAAPAAARIVKVPDVDLSRIHPVNRDEVERILTKARESGLDSLTNQERTFLSHFTQEPA
ncbi:MAG TPA: rhomboid family intramembrane serine protease [Gemmatimonadaceae bacterium]|nr:rhomboid family intramembrane serine protease [Gemmatimonadaceae bacterium]